MVTSTLPSGSTRTARAIPNSTMSVPSSGSITARRIPYTSSTVGSVGSAMGPWYGSRDWVPEKVVARLSGEETKSEFCWRTR